MCLQFCKDVQFRGFLTGLRDQRLMNVNSGRCSPNSQFPARPSSSPVFRNIFSPAAHPDLSEKDT
jgi:hypothetical protein